MITLDFAAKIKCPKCGYDGFDDDVDFWGKYPILGMGDDDIATIKCLKCDNEIEIIVNEKRVKTFTNLRRVKC